MKTYATVKRDSTRGHALKNHVTLNTRQEMRKKKIKWFVATMSLTLKILDDIFHRQA